MGTSKLQLVDQEHKLQSIWVYNWYLKRMEAESCGTESLICGVSVNSN